MNRKTVRLVQESWDQLSLMAPEAAALFYANLFAADPSLRSLFKGDMQEQGRRLMTMIGVAVRMLERLDALIPAVQDLGRRHAGYGVREEHYNTVGGALLMTLGQGLGEDYTPEVADAWADVYSLLAETMMAACEAETTA
ncbi:globin family protein [Chitinimonas sp.]|uniref:globin family protein n=1 Tax=Chitinimonas sp. TaxID=1934313 RepID=UPI002F94CD58